MGVLQSRPKLSLPRSAFETALQVLAAIGVVAMLWMLASAWPKLPATVPTHFGISGQADNWGSKSTLLILPLIGVLLFAGMSVLEAFPHVYNYPVQLTEENVAQQYRIAGLCSPRSSAKSSGCSRLFFRRRRRPASVTAPGFRRCYLC